MKPLRILPQVVALSILAAFALPAAAQSAGSNVVNVGWFHFSPQDSSEPLTFAPGSPLPGALANSGASISNADTVGLALTHFYTDNFALTFDIGVPPKFTLTGNGSLASLGELGTAKQWSPAVVAKWFFGEANDRFRPFAGIGVTRVWYSDVNLSQSLQTNALVSGGTGGTATADLSSSWAPVANGGVVYNFDKNWSLGLSVSYIPLHTYANITGRSASGTTVSQSSTKLTIDPIVTFLSVGYKF
jgi:outer membrane protein